MSQSLAQESLQKFIEMVSFPTLGCITNYKIQYAIDEASQSFLQEKKPAGKYICNGDEVFFADETLLNSEQKAIFKSVPKREVDLPYIFMLATDSVKNLPVKLETFYADEFDYSSKKY